MFEVRKTDTTGRNTSDKVVLKAIARKLYAACETAQACVIKQILDEKKGK